MIRPRRFPDHKYKNRLFLFSLRDRSACHRRGHLLETGGHRGGHVRHIAHGPINGGGRIDHETHFAVIANERGIILIEKSRRETDHREAGKNDAAPDDGFAPP